MSEFRSQESMNKLRNKMIPLPGFLASESKICSDGSMRAFFITLFFGLAAAAFAQGAKPNIVFIMADDLGYGEVGSYGQKLIQTPMLDRLAAEGMRFTQFYAGNTVCAPSRSVLMTGKHRGHTRVRGNAAENPARRMLRSGD